MHLAGLVSTRATRLEKAVVRFAAKSSPVEALTTEESAAMGDFVRAMEE